MTSASAHVHRRKKHRDVVFPVVNAILLILLIGANTVAKKLDEDTLI